MHSFFNQQLDENLIASLLHLAKSDPDVRVRASAWESLTDATDNPDIVAEMLAVLHDSNVSLQERGSVLVGLAPEADRNEVRQAMEEFYQRPEARAKALEAMWRSVHSSFRDYFPRHLDDSDVEVKRSAIWGVGYFGIKSELEKLRRLFDDEELRPDALFAYSLAVPGETSDRKSVV